MSYWRRRYQTGGVKPLYTQNPNDPRLRAYQDSLAARKNTDDEFAAWKMLGYDTNSRFLTHPQARKEFGDNFMAAVPDVYYGKTGAIESTGVNMVRHNNAQHGINEYPKPKQPVIYQKPQGKYTPQQAYNDSLVLYNANEKDYKILNSGVSGKDWENLVNSYYLPNGNINPNLPREVAYQRLKRNNGVAPTPTEKVSKQFTLDYHGFVNRYQKPVGTPVSKRRTSSAQLLPDEMNGINPQVQGRTSPNVDVNKEIKTNYSFTYRTPEGGQKSRYFPDLDSWKDFMKDKTYITQKVSGDKKSAQATGYYQEGGEEPKSMPGLKPMAYYHAMASDTTSKVKPISRKPIPEEFVYINGVKTSTATDPNEKVDGPIGYLNSYYESPMFKYRFLQNNSPADYEAQMKSIKSAENKFKPAVVPEAKDIGSHAYTDVKDKKDIKRLKGYGVPTNTTLVLDQKQANDYNEISAQYDGHFNLLNNVLPHEYAHTTRKLGIVDNMEFAKRWKEERYKGTYNEEHGNAPIDYLSRFSTSGSKKDFSEYYKDKNPFVHDELPDENYADLQSVRYNMYKNGIYDSRKRQMTIDDLKKAQQNPVLNQDFNFKRLFNNFTPEQIVELNNKVAKNKTEMIPKAQQGGSFTPEEVKMWNNTVKWYQDNGYGGDQQLNNDAYARQVYAKAMKATGSTLQYNTFIPRVQGFLTNDRQKAIDMYGQGKMAIGLGDKWYSQNPKLTPAYNPEFMDVSELQKKMNKLSGIDGIGGPLTTSSYIPQVNQVEAVDNKITKTKIKPVTGSDSYQEGGVKKYQAGDQILPNDPFRLRTQIYGPEITADHSALLEFNQLLKQPQQGPRPDTSRFDFSANTKPYKRQFDLFNVNAFGYGLMAANNITAGLLKNKDDHHYEQYRQDWFRKYSIPSNLQDPNKFGQDEFKDGGWISGAVNPDHAGYCTPMTKETCTPRRKAFARRAKDHFKQDGGMTLTTPEDQAAGYFGFPEASYLHFPGEGERTFVPGPFPIKLKDDNGTRALRNKPLKTKGAVTEMKFKEGGEVTKHAPKVKRSEATIEAEKDELIFGAGAPGSIEDQKDRVGVGLFKIGGQKHSNGGTPLKAFPGDFVYSNDMGLAFSKEDAKDLIGEEINQKKLRTPAKLAQKFLDLNENIQNAQNKKLDDVTKKTAIYNVNNFVNKLADIAYAQEEKKGFPTGIPEFAQASLQSRGFNAEALQGQLNQMRYGGEIKKFQKGGVTEEQFKKAKRVNKVTGDYKYIGDYDGNQVYMNPQGELVHGEQATKSNNLAPSNEKYLQDIIKRDPNLQHLPSSEVTKLGWGNQKDPLWKIWDEKYYQPKADNYVFTQPPAEGNPYDHDFNLPFGSRSGVPPTNPNNTFNPKQEEGLDNYTSIPNSKFNVNFPEAFSIYAASKPYKSRYPTAYRNYEIQNAKSLVASNSNQPSVEPYLSAIRRSTLGAPDTQGNFAAGLTAQNQAINGVYNQHLARRDAQNGALANLEIQDGIDRITNFEKYDTKIETLNNNKELADKYKNANLGNIFNTMKYDREYKTLLNTTSDYYQIDRDGSLGIKPAYKIKNGRLEPYQRNVADMIRQAGTSANQGYIGNMEQIFKLMRQYGITSLRDVNDVLGAATIPTPRTPGN